MEPIEAPGQRGISLAVVARFLDLATETLENAREEVDALNVYPVPDGDTGTNMYLTTAAALEALRSAPRGGEGFGALGRGALLGARGNSGVILSEMIRAAASRLGSATRDERHALVVAESLRMAADAAYAAVGTPVEGTMLTVARAAADGALERCEDAEARTADVVAAAAAAAREALEATPSQLQALADAGVVDAGGRGVSAVLDALETAMTGRRPSPATTRGRPQIPVPRQTAPADAGGAGDGLSEEGPAYEVMYLLDAEPHGVPSLRDALAGLGDSLVVVGDEGLWNVHVHVDDVGAAIEAGIEAGRPHRIRVTHFAEQAAAQRRAERQPRQGRRVVAVAAGPGLAALYEQAGAVVVPGGPGRRPSTGEVLAAITGCAADEVIVLPNDSDSVRVVQVAASTAEQDEGIRVTVIPTKAQVQGLAALAVHEPGRAFDADVLEMTATARHARHGAVTVAVRAAITMAGPCEPGDVLGVVAGDFTVVGEGLDEVAAEVTDRLLGGGGELVTVVSGSEDAGGALARRLAAWVEEHHPYVDVVVYDGGQERYPLLLSVE